MADEEESVEQHTWNSTRGAYAVRQKKEGNLETREELASRCHWEGVTVTRKKQRTTKQQTEKNSKLDSQPY